MQRYTNVGEVPLALAVFLATDNYDYSPDPNEISATTLIKPLRQTILAARVPPSDALVSLPDLVKNRMGQAIHDSIERAWKNEQTRTQALQSLGYPKRVYERILVNPTPEELAATEGTGIPVYLEQRLKRKVGKWTVTGKFDFIGEGRVQDFKSTSVFTYMNQVNNNKYTLQGSIYRWLDPKKITQHEMDIHFIFTDHQASKAKVDPNYPQHAFKKQTFPLISERDTDLFIRQKLALIEKYWNAPEDEIPECSDEELWRSEPVFKYYKNPAKATEPGARSTKNFDNLHDANLRLVEDGSVGVVVEKPGQATACRYCAAYPLCSQKDRLIAAGDLSL